MVALLAIEMTFAAFGLVFVLLNMAGVEIENQVYYVGFDYTIRTLFPVYIDNFISKSPYGKIYYHLVLGIIFIVIFRYYKNTRSLSNDKDVENPYTIQLTRSGYNYHIQFGFYSLTADNHPSLEKFEHKNINKNGIISSNEYVMEIQTELDKLFNRIIQEGNLSIQIHRVGGSELFPKFTVLVYSIQRFRKKEDYDFYHFNSIEQLHNSDPFFKRKELTQIPFDCMQNIVLDLDDHMILFDTKLMNAYFIIPTFELGMHELEVFEGSLSKFNDQIVQLHATDGKHYLGEDIYDKPVYIDKPKNIMYLGSGHIPQILDFDFFSSPLLFTDDKKLISEIQERFGNSVEIAHIEDLSFDLLSKYIDYPHFFQIVLNLWEELLPASIKKSYKGVKTTPVINEFLNLHYVLRNEIKLKLGDLLMRKTYVDFGKENISNEIKNKFDGIFYQSFFNADRKSLVNYCNGEQKIKVIYCDNSEYRFKMALMILFLVMKSQSLIQNSLLFSFEEEGIEFEKFISSILDQIDFHDVLVNLRSTGRVTNWIQKFSLYLCDSTFSDEKLINHFFQGYPRNTKGIYLNMEHCQRAILKEV